MVKKVLYYFIIACINLMPFIPLSNKGIIGLVFIMISSIKSDLKGTMQTTIALIVFQTFSYFMKFSVDYEHGIPTMIMGTVAYLAIAYIFGSHTEKIRNMITELRVENENRKSLETVLQQKIALQDSLINTIPIPLYFKDLNFNYVGFNPAFSEIVEEQEIIGKKVFDLFDPCIAEICNQMDIDLICEKRKQSKEISVSTTNGNMKTIINSKALIINNEGEIDGIVGVLLDITEQKESEELKTSIAELKREEQLKTEFFSNISHELRTPLNVIYSAVQMIEMSVNDDDYISSQNKIKRNTLSIKQNCMRLQRLVNNLIDITKIDASAFELQIQNSDIVNVIEEIVLSVADFTSNKGIILVFDTDIEEKIMAFDEEKMERIILNLLSNAIKYTPDGGTINVSIFDKGDRVLIQIRDSGIGIPKDQLGQIFNRFYQIYPINTRKQEGSGIGLNLVKSLVEMHQGEISVTSELEKGTVFTIDLPCIILESDMKPRPKIIDKHSRIEKIQLEFSDIYKITNRSNLPV